MNNGGYEGLVDTFRSSPPAWKEHRSPPPPPSPYDVQGRNGKYRLRYQLPREVECGVKLKEETDESYGRYGTYRLMWK